MSENSNPPSQQRAEQQARRYLSPSNAPGSNPLSRQMTEQSVVMGGRQQTEAMNFVGRQETDSTYFSDGADTRTSTMYSSWRASPGRFRSMDSSQRGLSPQQSSNALNQHRTAAATADAATANNNADPDNSNGRAIARPITPPLRGPQQQQQAPPTTQHPSGSRITTTSNTITTATNAATTQRRQEAAADPLASLPVLESREQSTILDDNDPPYQPPGSVKKDDSNSNNNSNSVALLPHGADRSISPKSQPLPHATSDLHQMLQQQKQTSDFFAQATTAGGNNKGSASSFTPQTSSVFLQSRHCSEHLNDVTSVSWRASPQPNNIIGSSVPPTSKHNNNNNNEDDDDDDGMLEYISKTNVFADAGEAGVLGASATQAPAAPPAEKPIQPPPTFDQPAAVATTTETEQAAPPKRLTGTNLFVVGLLQQITNDQLRQLFEPFGDVISATVKIDIVTGNSTGFGFVQFREEKHAELAIQHMNKAKLGPNTLHVSKSHHNGALESSKSLFIRNFPAGVKRHEIKRVFIQYGEVTGMQCVLGLQPAADGGGAMPPPLPAAANAAAAANDGFDDARMGDGIDPGQKDLLNTDGEKSELPMLDNINFRCSVTIHFAEEKMAAAAMEALSRAKELHIPALELKVEPPPQMQQRQQQMQQQSVVGSMTPPQQKEEGGGVEDTPAVRLPTVPAVKPVELEPAKHFSLKAPLIVKYGETARGRRDRHHNVARNERIDYSTGSEPRDPNTQAPSSAGSQAPFVPHHHHHHQSGGHHHHHHHSFRRDPNSNRTGDSYYSRREDMLNAQKDQWQRQMMQAQQRGGMMMGGVQIPGAFPGGPPMMMPMMMGPGGQPMMYHPHQHYHPHHHHHQAQPMGAYPMMMMPPPNGQQQHHHTMMMGQPHMMMPPMWPGQQQQQQQQGPNGGGASDAPLQYQQTGDSFMASNSSGSFYQQPQQPTLDKTAGQKTTAGASAYAIPSDSETADGGAPHSQTQMMMLIPLSGPPHQQQQDGPVASPPHRSTSSGADLSAQAKPFEPTKR